MRGAAPDADERSRVTPEKHDTASGEQEILARPIGRNELDAIQACLAFIDTQPEYAEADRDGTRQRARGGSSRRRASTLAHDPDKAWEKSK